MSSQFQAGQNANIKTKTSVLLFLKGSVAPVILYFENPQQIYANVQKILQAGQAPKILELEANGPIKKVSVITTEITGVALQDEQYVVKA